MRRTVNFLIYSNSNCFFIDDTSHSIVQYKRTVYSEMKTRGLCGDFHGFSVGLGWVWGLKSSLHSHSIPDIRQSVLLICCVLQLTACAVRVVLVSYFVCTLLRNKLIYYWTFQYRTCSRNTAIQRFFVAAATSAHISVLTSPLSFRRLTFIPSVERWNEYQLGAE